MTAPTVTETTPRPEAVVHDPFIDDVQPPAPQPPATPHRKIFD